MYLTSVVYFSGMRNLKEYLLFYSLQSLPIHLLLIHFRPHSYRSFNGNPLPFSFFLSEVSLSLIFSVE
jgi:hypothetical protein